MSSLKHLVGQRVGGNGETTEGRELVAKGGKQIFANTSSDV